VVARKGVKSVKVVISITFSSIEKNEKMLKLLLILLQKCLRTDVITNVIDATSTFLKIRQFL
jgi:hypothetical protein